MGKKLKKSTQQTIFVGVICSVILILVFGTAYIVNIKQIKSSYQTKLDTVNQEIEKNKKEVYIAKKTIALGEKISEENIEIKQKYISLSKETYISQNDIGKIALLEITKDTPIQKNMISEKVVERSVREEEFNTFYLSSNLKENDFVDIRILYPNGEDYIVLSKKSVKDLDLEKNNCFLWLDEEETIYISSAIIDTFLNEGTKLYTTKYVEPSLQSSAYVTYEPKEEVMAMMEKDHNIDKIAARAVSERIRKELDERLQTFYASNQNVVDWNSVRQSQTGGSYYDSESVNSTNKSESNYDIDDEAIPSNSNFIEYEEDEIQYVD